MTWRDESKGAVVRNRLILLAVLAALCLLCVNPVQAEESSAAEGGPVEGELREPEKASEEESEKAPEEEPEEPQPTPLELLQAVTIRDIPAESPAYDAARYVVSRGIMYGKSGGAFAPDSPVTRAELAVVLHRLSGGEAPAGRVRFSDVARDAWCADAAAWAVEAGVLGGEGYALVSVSQEGGPLEEYQVVTFSPQGLVTRAELAQALYRCSQLRNDPKGPVESLESYRDGGSVAKAGREAMSWALGAGIFRTVIADEIQPNVAVSRLQLAQGVLALESAVDALAADVLAKQPARVAESAARKNHDAIQAVVDSAAKKYGAVSLQVAVVENGVVTDTYAYGWATKGEERMTDAHKLRVASISKVAVGLSAMLLREKGTIDLDQSIGKYWGCTVRNPHYPNKPVTIRSLLTHTSSVFNAGDDVSRAYNSVKARLSKGTGFSRAVPGALSSWTYNNYGFAVLGMTLELAANRTLDAILMERLFPAMDIDGGFYAGDIRATDKLTTLYRGGSVTRSRSSQKGQHAGKPGASGAYFAGGLTISARDLAKLAAMLAEDGKYEGVRLLSEKSVELMETHEDRTVPDGSYQAMPLRARRNIYGRNKLYYHTGSAYGVFNCFSYDPAARDGVVVLSVGASGVKDGNGIYAVCGAISGYIYKVIR